jgi:hypothetical protein
MKLHFPQFNPNFRVIICLLIYILFNDALSNSRWRNGANLPNIQLTMWFAPCRLMSSFIKCWMMPVQTAKLHTQSQSEEDCFILIWLCHFVFSPHQKLSSSLLNYRNRVCKFQLLSELCSKQSPSLTDLVSHSPVIHVLFLVPSFYYIILKERIFWHVDQLLGNNPEISNYATTVAK